MSSTVTSWSPDSNTKASETTSSELNNATLSGTLTVTGATTLSSTLAVTGATALNGGINAALTLSNTLTVGSDGSGHDVTFYGDTSTRDLIWDESQNRLRANDNTQITVGTGNDCTLYHSGSETILNCVGDLSLAITSGTLKLGTQSAQPVSIGHTTSEVTINDNLTVTGTLTLGSGAELTEAELEMLDGITAGTVIASKAIVTDSNIDITGGRNITISGELDAATLDISGNVDIDGTTNLVSLDVVGDPGDNGTIVSFTNSHATVDDHDNILKLRFSGDADASEGNFILFGDGDTAEMGVIKANSATVVVDSYSDYRIKNTIATLSGGLAKVDALRPVTFKYTSDSRNTTHEGFIAHEVQEQIPYAVRGIKDAVNDDGSIKKQSFCIYQLIPQMVSAIQELSAKVTVLENA